MTRWVRWLLLGVVGVELIILAERYLTSQPGAGPAASPIRSGKESLPQGIEAVAIDVQPEPIADAAVVLGGFRHTIEWQAKSWRDDLGIEVHVVTLRNARLPAEPLADEVFQERRIGESAPSGGLLILLNPARGEARIEVSYALEHVFPDLIVGRVTRDQLAPYAAYRIAGMAVMDVLHFLKDYAYLQALRGNFDLSEALRARPEFAEKARYLSGGAGARATLETALDHDRDFKAILPADRRASYAPSRDPLESAERYLRAMREQVGDPTLDLYTPGTRCMLAAYPYAPFEQLERTERAEASRPLRVTVQGDHAVADSERPAHGFVPILLEQRDGLWRVDLVETWKNLFFGPSGDYHQVNSNHSYGFGLERFGAARAHAVAPWLLATPDPTAARVALAERKGAVDAWLLGELLFRNCWLAVDALAHYERALALSPGNLRFLETLGDRAAYIGFFDLAAGAYAELGPAGLLPLAHAQRSAHDLDAALASTQRALERDPYWIEALELQLAVLRERQDAAGAKRVDRRIAEIRSDPGRPDDAVTLRFDPPYPVLHSDRTVRVGDTDVYDYSEFALTLANPSARAVEILGVTMTSNGTAGRSNYGLDMKDYWKYPSGGHRLGPGEFVRFGKSWGYDHPIEQHQLRYVFDVCWKGDGTKQCRAYWVDLTPASFEVAGLSDPARAQPTLAASLERARRASPELAARLELLALLRERRFDALTRRVEAEQAAFEADPSREAAARQMWDTFASTDPTLAPLLAAWTEAVDSYAADAALGIYHRRTGWESRGEANAGKTSSAQFRSMRTHHELARESLGRALAANPRLMFVYESLISVNRSNRDEARRLTARAGELCPSCVGPGDAYLNGITPRWGGSYDEMTRFLQELQPRIAAHPQLAALNGMIAVDRADTARFDRDYEAALRLYDEALSHGEHWRYRRYRGQTLFWLGRYEEALADFEAWIAHGTRTAEALMWKAYTLGKLHRRDEAAHAIALARALDGGDDEIERLARRYGVADEI